MDGTLQLKELTISQERLPDVTATYIRWATSGHPFPSFFRLVASVDIHVS